MTASTICVRKQLFNRSLIQCINARSLATSAQKRAAKRLAAAGKPVPPRPGLPQSSKIIDPKKITKAPHMRGDGIKKTGIIDRLKEAPFIPMVVVFPTLMMGIALMIRPDMREQVFGGKKKAKKVIPLDVEKPVDEKIALQEAQNITVVPHPADAAVKEKRIKETKRQNDSNEQELRDILYAIGIRPHRS